MSDSNCFRTSRSLDTSSHIAADSQPAVRNKVMDCTNDSQSDQEDSSLEIDGYELTDNADQNLNVLKDGIIHVYRRKYGGVQLALNGHLFTRDRTSKLIQIQHKSNCKIIQQDSGTSKPK